MQWKVTASKLRVSILSLDLMTAICAWIYPYLFHHMCNLQSFVELLVDIFRLKRAPFLSGQLFLKKLAFTH